MTVDNWGFIKSFYSKNGIFDCSPCGEEKGAYRADIEHVLAAPASDSAIRTLEARTGRALTPSYGQFLLIANGAIFFSQRRRCRSFFRRRRAGMYEGGFMLYAADDVPERHKEVMEWLKDSELIDVYFENPEMDQEVLAREKKACWEWLDSIIVIGEELHSGNYIAIDYTRNRAGPEHPIIFISHEVPYEISCEAPSPDGTYDACRILGDSVDEVLVKAAREPATFLTEMLGDCTRYSDGRTDIQWYPDSYRTV
jgi:hypothetical protein